MSLFLIVGSSGPLYRAQLRPRRDNETAYVDEFVLHAALDVVDEKQWSSGARDLRVVDRFNDQLVSAFVTATNMKLLLLHDNRNEDGIYAFFKDVHELYLKLLLNPFYTYDSAIDSEVFDARVKTLARRHL